MLLPQWIHREWFQLHKLVISVILCIQSFITIHNVIHSPHDMFVFMFPQILMSVLILETITVAPMPTARTLLEATTVPVKLDTLGMALHVKVHSYSFCNYVVTTLCKYLVECLFYVRVVACNFVHLKIFYRH